MKFYDVVYCLNNKKYSYRAALVEDNIMDRIDPCDIIKVYKIQAKTKAKAIDKAKSLPIERLRSCPHLKS